MSIFWLKKIDRTKDKRKEEHLKLREKQKTSFWRQSEIQKQGMKQRKTSMMLCRTYPCRKDLNNLIQTLRIWITTESNQQIRINKNTDRHRCILRQRQRITTKKAWKYMWNNFTTGAATWKQKFWNSIYSKGIRSGNGWK